MDAILALRLLAELHRNFNRQLEVAYIDINVKKLQKLQKGDYPTAHRLSINVLMSNSTFLQFLQF